jgi:hypothetical protein
MSRGSQEVIVRYLAFWQSRVSNQAYERDQLAGPSSMQTQDAGLLDDWFTFIWPPSASRLPGMARALDSAAWPAWRRPLSDDWVFSWHDSGSRGAPLTSTHHPRLATPEGPSGLGVTRASVASDLIALSHVGSVHWRSSYQVPKPCCSSHLRSWYGAIAPTPTGAAPGERRRRPR